MIGVILITLTALILYVLDFTQNVVMAIGGVIGSGLWLYSLYKYGVGQTQYEWLAAFTWMVFSLLSFLY